MGRTWDNGQTQKMRLRAFADVYSRTFHVTKAAIAAGCPPAGAASQGSKMLRHPFVQELLKTEYTIDRKLHADKTYRQMIELADAAILERRRLEAMIELEMKKEEKDRSRDYLHKLALDYHRSIEVAGRQHERLGRMEGLITDLPPEGAKALAATLQRLSMVAGQMPIIAKPQDRIIDASAKVVEAKVVDPPKNGNGNGHGPDWKAITE